ncbi:MAG: 50S ribosomal protein L35ae [Candidatus Nanoarchaeia archaeon]
MEGQVIHYRRGKRTYHGNQLIVHVESVDSREKAKSMMDKKVTWTSPAGKKLVGKVTNMHGNKGGLRVQFETGMPGQVIGQKVLVE